MRTTTLVALLATVAVLVGAAGGVATADPDAGCIGTERGAAFQADSGFTVWYNDSEPMPSNGVFQGDDTLRFRDVTLTSGGATELVLEDGTGPETCVGGIDAAAAPIVIDPDGEQAVRVGGQVRALSVADAQYGDGTADLAYDATAEWSIVVTDTGFGQGTTIEAVDAGGSTLATGTVDGSGAVRLTLPSGTYDVALREESGTQSDGGTDSGGDGGDDGDGSADDSSDTGGNATDDGSGDGSTSGSDDGGSDGTGDESDGGDSDSGLPWLLIGGGLAAVVVAGGVGYVLNGDGVGDASGGDGTASPDTEEGVPREAGSAAGAPAAAESGAATADDAEPADVEGANDHGSGDDRAANDDGAEPADVEDANADEAEPAEASGAEDDTAAEGREADDERAGDTEDPSEE